MTIRALNHFTVMSRDLDASREFYCEVLGMEVGARPPMSFPGLWLYAEGAPILHLVGVQEATASRNGVIDHVALTASNLREVVGRLQARNIKHSLRGTPDRGWQLFCRDPDGAMIELAFAAEEIAPEDIAS